MARPTTPSERATRYENQGVTVRQFDQRRGKAAVLNDLVSSATGEIVVFADARQRFEPGAIRALVANFADPDVGAVSGELAPENGEARRLAEKAPGFTGSTKSSSVPMKAGLVRRSAQQERFTPSGGSCSSHSADTILDDVVIPVRIFRRGYRVLFEAEARAHDLVSGTPREDFIRKTRTIAGTFQLFARETWLLNPRRSRSGSRRCRTKRCAWRYPLLHLVMFVANLVLVELLVLSGPDGGAAGVLRRRRSSEVSKRTAPNSRRRNILLTVPLHDVSARLGHDRGICTNRGPPAAGHLGKDARRTRTARCLAACVKPG